MGVEFMLNQANVGQIAEHLTVCDTDFVPPLSDRVQINNYSQKLAINATRFEAWSAGSLAGLVAAYCNSQVIDTTYISSVSVNKTWRGRGIAESLLRQCIEYSITSDMHKIYLQVGHGNSPAIHLYKKAGFAQNSSDEAFITMVLYLNSGG